MIKTMQNAYGFSRDQEGKREKKSHSRDPSPLVPDHNEDMYMYAREARAPGHF